MSAGALPRTRARSQRTPRYWTRSKPEAGSNDSDQRDNSSSAPLVRLEEEQASCQPAATIPAEQAGHTAGQEAHPLCIKKNWVLAGLFAGPALVLGIATTLSVKELKRGSALVDELARPSAAIGKPGGARSSGAWQHSANHMAIPQRSLESPPPLLDKMECYTLPPISLILVDDIDDPTWASRYLCCNNYGIACASPGCDGTSSDCIHLHHLDADNADKRHQDTDHRRPKATVPAFTYTPAPTAESANETSTTTLTTTTSANATTVSAATATAPATTTAIITATATDRTATPRPCDEQCSVGPSDGDAASNTCTASIVWVMQNVFTPGEDLAVRDSCELATNYVAKLCEPCKVCSSDLACLPGSADTAEEDEGSSDSLFCWALFIPGSNEEALLSRQMEERLGIFQCDGQSVYSNVSKTLKVDDSTLVVKVADVNLQCEYGEVTLEEGTSFTTAFNTRIFIAVWEKVVADGDFREFDWTIKVDTDAVFLPDRLRSVVRGLGHKDASESPGVFLLNCQLGLHGPVEVMSKTAILMWERFHSLCADPPEEDVYLQDCLNWLGVRQQDQFDLLAEDECRRGGWAATPDWASCQTGHVAFHPFKVVPEWMDCYNRATGNKTDIAARPLVDPIFADPIFA